MLIKELSAKTGFSVHALRFYEKEGILPERFVSRRGNNYREYSDAAAERVMAIKVMQSAGFTLSEIKDFIGRWDSGSLSQEMALDALERKKDEIDARISELRRIKATLVAVFEAHVKSASAP